MIVILIINCTKNSNAGETLAYDYEDSIFSMHANSLINSRSVAEVPGSAKNLINIYALRITTDVN